MYSIKVLALVKLRFDSRPSCYKVVPDPDMVSCILQVYGDNL